MRRKVILKGRPHTLKPKTNRMTIRFDDDEYAKFLSMYKQSGCYAKAVFIKARVFGDEFRAVKSTPTTSEYLNKLTKHHSKFRQIGVSYNQTVKELKVNFSEKRAVALLYRLEQQTKEMIKVLQEVIALTTEVGRQWHQRDEHNK